MALVIADRVQETTATAGTGTITLAGAVSGFQSFSVIGNGNTTYYTIVNGSNWEVGLGTYSTSGPTLSRTTILSSSNAGSAITLSGTSTVFCTYPAGRAVEKDATNNFTLDAGTATTAALAFVSGSNLTTASAGAMEYDGKVFYATPQGTQRGVVPGMQYYRLNSGYVGASSTSAQTMFGVGVTLSSSTTYQFECVFGLKYTGTPASHTVSSLFGGTATLNNIQYFIIGTGNISGVINVAGNTTVGLVNVATATVLTGAQTTANNLVSFHSRGTISVNSGGTFIPQYQLSALLGAAYTTTAGSYFLIYPIGASGSNVSVGTWA